MNRPLSKLRFSRFCGSFEPLFDFKIWGGHIRKLILPPNFERTARLRALFFRTGSSGLSDNLWQRICHSLPERRISFPSGLTITHKPFMRQTLGPQSKMRSKMHSEQDTWCSKEFSSIKLGDIGGFLGRRHDLYLARMGKNWLS